MKLSAGQGNLLRGFDLSVSRKKDDLGHGQKIRPKNICAKNRPHQKQETGDRLGWVRTTSTETRKLTSESQRYFDAEVPRTFSDTRNGEE